MASLVRIFQDIYKISFVWGLGSPLSVIFQLLPVSFFFMFRILLTNVVFLKIFFEDISGCVDLRFFFRFYLFFPVFIQKIIYR